MDTAKRIKLAKRHRGFSNCFGTALYIAGIKEKDEFVPHIYDYLPTLEALPKTSKPTSHSLVLFYKKEHSRYLDHMAVVTSLSPLLVVHRPHDCSFGPVAEVPIEDVCKIHGNDIEYRKKA
jgi:hypothetical protein